MRSATGRGTSHRTSHRSPGRDEPRSRRTPSEETMPPPAVVAFTLPKLTAPPVIAAHRYAEPVEVTRTTLVEVTPRMLTAFVVGAPLVYLMEWSNSEACSGSNPANVAFSAR